jgi:hypothetical protein
MIQEDRKLEAVQGENPHYQSEVLRLEMMLEAMEMEAALYNSLGDSGEEGSEFWTEWSSARDNVY